MIVWLYEIAAMWSDLINGDEEDLLTAARNQKASSWVSYPYPRDDMLLTFAPPEMRAKGRDPYGYATALWIGKR